MRDGSLEFGAISYDPADPNLGLFCLYVERVRMSLRHLLLSAAFLERNIKIPVDGSRPLACLASAGQIVDNCLVVFRQCWCPWQVRSRHSARLC